MYGNVAKLPVMFVEAGDVALIVARIDDERVAGIGSDIASFTPADRVPVFTIDIAL